MTTWFTADLHLGHENIIRYCDRPFGNVDEMNDVLVTRWNAVVDDSDVVWVLGDVALGRIDHTLSLIGTLRGRKLLLAGNHDRCWSGHGRRADGWTARYLEAGFDEVHQGQVEVSAVGGADGAVAGAPLIACHFPYRGDSHDQDRYLDYRPIDRGAWLLHGHVHERWRQLGRMINVGVDVWDYAPVSEETLGALVAAGPHEVAAR